MGVEENENTGSGPSKPTTPTSDSGADNMAESNADTIDPDKSSFNDVLGSQADAVTLDSAEMTEDDLEAAEKEPLAGPSGTSNHKNHKPVSPTSNSASIDDLISEDDVIMDKSRHNEDDSDRLNTCTEDFESQVKTSGDGPNKKTWDVRCVVIGVLVLLILVAGAVAAIIAHRFKGPSMEYDFKFASLFNDGMVLQRAPHKAIIWGYGPILSENTTVKVILTGPGTEREYTTHVKNTVSGQMWKVAMDPVVDARGPYSLSASLDVENGQQVTLSNLVFGDVWVCAGQFDDEINLNDLYNTTEVQELSGLRLLGLWPYQSNVPRYDIKHIQVPWTAANNLNLAYKVQFPKLCYEYGQKLHQKMGYPIGLISMTASDSLIEDWTPHRVLKECDLNVRGSTSTIWHGMVSPLLNMAFYGAIWYQGENDAIQVKGKFNCSFLGFIDQWRNHTFRRTHGSTDRYFPFGIIQLPPNRTDTHLGYKSFMAVRWSQTANYGTVPNELMKRVFLAATMDLPETEGQDPYPVMVERLMKGALSVAYKKKNVTYQGPVPTQYAIADADASLTLYLNNNTATIERVGDAGFEICCSERPDIMCLASLPRADYAPGREWIPAPVSRVASSSVTLSWAECQDRGHHPVGLRYAWSDTPCGWKSCVVYGTFSGLPMLPYIKQELENDGRKHELRMEQINLI